MAFSTGVTLLTSGSFLLKDQLADFWEFDGGGLNRYLGGSSVGTTTGASSTNGVDGATGSGIQIDTAWNATRSWVNTGAPFRSTGSTETICFFASSASNISARWGSSATGTTGTTSCGILLSLDSQVLYRLQQNGVVSENQTALPSPSSANNGYNFYCVTRSGVGGSINTFSFYDSTGSLLGQRVIGSEAGTANFGLLEAAPSSVSNIAKLDKVAWFIGQLSSQQISFLFNSGNGRTGSEIISATI